MKVWVAFHPTERINICSHKKVVIDNYTGTLSGSVKRSSSLTVKFYAKTKGDGTLLICGVLSAALRLTTQFGL